MEALPPVTLSSLSESYPLCAEGVQAALHIQGSGGSVHLRFLANITKQENSAIS